MAEKHVYYFGGGKADGRAEMRNLLGGKGANLAEMTNIGLPVPAGFTISTDVCTYFYEHGGDYPETLEREVGEALGKIEEVMGSLFGDPKDPLLLSIRSGARVSMPGMMDTVLNLGLNEKTVEGLAAKAGDRRFAFDCYRRFVQMYGDVVMGLGPEEKDDLDPFEEILSGKKEEVGASRDIDLGVDDLEDLVSRYK
ncbi:MAG TPA: pyruvate, phosphate dikinase, partial [Candidatus Eisenbacteria bacterium]|nr:pyruvate, phosphate dikinase [Candidatus Eisenbacteria bacterium]